MQEFKCPISLSLISITDNLCYIIKHAKIEKRLSNSSVYTRIVEIIQQKQENQKNFHQKKAYYYNMERSNIDASGFIKETIVKLDTDSSQISSFPNVKVRKKNWKSVSQI